MGIEQFHSSSRIWHYVEDSKFTMDFQSLEDYFNKRAREEELTTEKQWVSIKSIEVDTPTRSLNINTELYRLLEN